jgi:hypothetical protein
MQRVRPVVQSSTASAPVRVHNKGQRRLSPAGYRLALTTHIVASGGWLGVVFAKLVLGTIALTTGARQLVGAMDALNIAFPPLAIGAILSGVVLSIGTRWDLRQHYWVMAKLVLSVGVIGTAVQLMDRFTRAALTDPSSTSSLALLALTALHFSMLLVATVLSVYKPWGSTLQLRGSGVLRLVRVGDGAR